VSDDKAEPQGAPAQPRMEMIRKLAEDAGYEVVEGVLMPEGASLTTPAAVQPVSAPSPVIPDVLCLDCGRPYPHGLDVVLTKKQWRMINPDDGGVLCASCMVNRASLLPEVIGVDAYIVFAPDYDTGSDTVGNMLTTLRLENADYCRETLEARHRIDELESALRVARKQEVRLEEGQRQATLMALAHLAVERPGWKHMLSEIALLMDNRGANGEPELFGRLHTLREKELQAK
jgi:hypothetical protein